MRLSLVIPTYNSASFIEENIICILREMPSEIYEIVIVDDGSTDETYSILKKLADNNPCIHIVHMERNMGQSYSTTAGIRQAECSMVVTFDDDLQYGVNEIEKLIAVAGVSDGFQVVYGYPRYKQHKKTYNAFTHAAIYILRNIFIPNLKKIKGISSFVLINRDGFGGDIFHPIYVWDMDGSKIFNAEVEHRPSIGRTSNYTFGKYIKHFLPLLIFLFSRSLLVIGLIFALTFLWSGQWTLVILTLLLFLSMKLTLSFFLWKLKHRSPNVNEHYPIDKRNRTL